MINTRKTVTIWRTRDSWSLSPSNNPNIPSQNCKVLIEIQGNDNDGYYLLISPEGYCMADYWYQSKKEALKYAHKLFDVKENEFSNNGIHK